MDENELFQKGLDPDEDLSEGADKVSLFEMLSQDFETVLASPQDKFTTEHKSEIIQLLKHLTDTVNEFIVSPNTKWKSRESYRHIRSLQKICTQYSAFPQITNEAVRLIDKLNVYSFHLEDITEVANDFYAEEELYWEELAMQEDDSSYVSQADLCVIDYIKKIDSASLRYNDFLNELRIYNPRAFNELISRLDDFDEYEHWHHIDELIEIDEPISELEENDDEIEIVAENKIQSHPDLAILDTYRESLLFLDETPSEKIKIIFWQNDYEKFVHYCSENGLITMLQLFDLDLTKLYGFGFNHTRIMQISDIMEEWADKILNPADEIEPDETADQDYEDIMSVFFGSDSEEADENEEEDEDENNQIDDEDF